MKKHVQFTRCNVDIWRKKLVHEIILYFAQKAIYLKESNVNIVGVSRTKKGEKIKMFFAGAWIYPDKDTRHYLRIKIKPKKIGAGLSFNIKTNIKKGIGQSSALQGLKSVARVWQEITERKYGINTPPNKGNNLSPGWSKK